MSEKSDLRERAKYYINNLKGMSGSMARVEYENGKGHAKVMEDLLQALDAAEGEERERCVKILQNLQSEYNDAGYNGALEDGIIDIRREGGE